MRKIKIIKIKQIKPEKVVAITTKNKTFIADGLYMHNCSSCNNMHQYYPFVFQDWLKNKIGVEEYEKMKEVVRMRPFYDMPFDEVISRINECLLSLQTERNG